MTLVTLTINMPHFVVVTRRDIQGYLVIGDSLMWKVAYASLQSCTHSAASESKLTKDVPRVRATKLPTMIFR